jgi:hypothetical protein
MHLSGHPQKRTRPLDDVRGVSAPADPTEVVSDASQVEEWVERVHASSGVSPLVGHGVRHSVLLPSKPRHGIVSLQSPPHVSAGVSGSGDVSIGRSQGIHSWRALLLNLELQLQATESLRE